jgi:hypothetical protein
MNVHTMLNMKEIGLATKHAASDTVVWWKINYLPDVVNNGVHAVDTLTGLLIDLIDNFDIANIIWMHLYIRDWKLYKWTIM